MKRTSYFLKIAGVTVVALFMTFALAQSHPLDPGSASDYEVYQSAWLEATVEDVREWLESGGDVNARDKAGRTALMNAVAMNKSLSLISMLIEQGADVNVQDLQFGRTALAYAAAVNDDPDVIHILAEAGADIELSDSLGKTPLIIAAHRSSGEVAKALLEAGAEVDSRDSDGKTALLGAIVNFNPDPTLVEVLIDAGANVNVRDFVRETALGYAASLYEVDIVKTLVEAGADVNARLPMGLTAMMLTDDPYTISILFEAGADLEIRNNDGETALLSAAWFAHDAAVKTLAEIGADVNAQNPQGATPLMEIVKGYSPDPDTIFFLLGMGADAKIRDVEGKTALDYADELGHIDGTEAYQLLLEATR